MAERVRFMSSALAIEDLRSMGEFLNMRRRIISAFRTALIYPAFVLTVAVGISWFVTFSLIPTLMENIRATSQLVGQNVAHEANSGLGWCH